MASDIDWFEQLSLADLARVGGKNAGLGFSIGAAFEKAEALHGR
jgi:hypothetical protein